MAINSLMTEKRCLQSNCDGVEEMQQIYIPNKKKRILGSVCFMKVDANDPTLTLGGAVFSLYMRNKRTGCYEEISSGYVTENNGMLNIDGLKPGQYMLMESEAPEGYIYEKIRTFFRIEVNDAGEVIEPNTILIGNHPKRKCCHCCRCCRRRYCCYKK